jgi:ElaB/YqjD/DUF883 family membrane-anchored ribosome-binding protein
MSTSEQLERETEEERARISETLDELRARMTPGHVVDRLVDYATDSSGGMFFRNLRQQAVDNPVPVALVGAGLAWLAIAGRRHNSTNRTSADSLILRTTDKISAAGDRMADRSRHATESASDTASKWTGQARSAAADLGQRGQATASKLQDTARETADSVTDTASSAYAAASQLAGDATSRAQGVARSAIDSVAETASTAYDAAADQARRAGDKLQSAGDKLQQSASDMRGRVAASSRSIMDFVYEQPLVVVGLGLAIGAAIGAASPSTEAEDELMGETSDAVKKETAELAKEQLEKGRAAAERVLQSASEEAEKQGLVSSSTDDDDAFTSRPDAA